MHENKTNASLAIIAVDHEMCTKRYAVSIYFIYNMRLITITWQNLYGEDDNEVTHCDTTFSSFLNISLLSFLAKTKEKRNRFGVFVLYFVNGKEHREEFYRFSVFAQNNEHDKSEKKKKKKNNHLWMNWLWIRNVKRNKTNINVCISCHLCTSNSFLHPLYSY